jgi:hypothetical protein
VGGWIGGFIGELIDGFRVGIHGRRNGMEGELESWKAFIGMEEERARHGMASRTK